MDSTAAVAVVGAGPQALTLCVHLLEGYPQLADDIIVLDPSGTWLEAWDRQFAALDIAHLRSPAVHHPHPDPYALYAFSPRPSDFEGRYHTPSTAVFRSFCHRVVDTYGLGRRVRPDTVERVSVGAHRCRVRARHGTLAARHVVVATNPGRPVIPRWAAGTGARHAGAVDLRTESVAGRTTLIVGGGLTTAHLALGVAGRGGRAIVLARSPRRAQAFDTDPGWLGPKYMTGFLREPCPTVRRALVRDARGGGSIPARYAAELDQRIAEGLVEWRAGEVAACRRTGRGFAVRAVDGTTVAADEVWLATGWRYDVTAVALLAEVRRRCPAAVAGGLPDLDADLAWPGTDVFLMGALAALQVGPTALNLSGARQAALRITAAIGRRLSLGPPDLPEARLVAVPAGGPLT